jgi:integrase
MGKLTKRFIEAAPAKEKAYILWDGDIPGFGVRVMPSGRKAFVLQYRIGRRSRTMSLGYTRVITPEKARGMAIAHLAAIEDNRDPLADRDDRREALSFRELAQRFEAEHIAVHLKPLTAAEYRRALKKAILPFFGRRPVAEVSREEIARFRHKFRHVPYFANRCLAILSKMLNLAELWGLRPDGSNPCRHIRKYKEERRERFLSAAELRRVGAVLSEMEAEGVEMASALVAIRLLILTGCRLGEILKLKWEHVDCDAGVLNLPDSKTGAKVVYLGQPAVDVLRTAPRLPANPWVVWGKKRGTHLYGLQDVWERVRARACLPEVRIHDLRHTFASTAVAAGQGLPMIGKLLGHTQVQTTARYAHLAADPVKAAAEQVSAVIAQAVSAGKERDKAVAGG